MCAWLPDPPDHLPGPDDVPRVVSVQQAVQLGFTRHAIAHRRATQRWHLVLPHTYLTGHTFTWRDRLDAALLFAGAQSLLTGAAALTDLGLRAVPRPDIVRVVVPARAGVRSAGYVRVTRSELLPAPALLPGPRRVPPARAVADLARQQRRLDDVRTVVAQAVRAGLCSVAELQAELASGPRPGSAHLRRAVADIGGGSWSAPEARAAAILRSAAIPPFRQNVTLRAPDGRRFVVDFYWAQLRAVLEIDSDEFHWNDPVARDRTAERQSALEMLGLTVMSRRPAVIDRRPREFRREVEAWLAARADELARR